MNFYIHCLSFTFISVHWVVVEEAQEEQSVFFHVHLLLDQVPRLKPRVELEVEQGVMVGDYHVMFV